MLRMLVDNDIGGHFTVLGYILHSDEWRELWSALACRIETFEAMNLSRQLSDREIWNACQSEGVVLLTGNRNKAGNDSLEATLEEMNQPDSVPVITVANPLRLLAERAYAERVAERLLDYLMNIENYRGVGRLYVP